MEACDVAQPHAAVVQDVHEVAADGDAVGVDPPDGTTERSSRPSLRTSNTEISLLPTWATSSCRPFFVSTTGPCEDRRILLVPSPPVAYVPSSERLPSGARL